MDIYENLQKSMVIYGICPCLADDDYTFCKAKHLLMMPLHLETRNLVNNWYFSLNCNRGPYPLFLLFISSVMQSTIRLHTKDRKIHGGRKGGESGDSVRWSHLDLSR